MGRLSCGECIMNLLKEKGGKATRNELRPLLIEKGYGAEAIRQAYLSLERNGKVTLIGSGRSRYQEIEIVERKFR